jgi:hypothetical protein
MYRCRVTGRDVGSGSCIKKEEPEVWFVLQRRAGDGDAGPVMSEINYAVVVNIGNTDQEGPHDAIDRRGGALYGLSLGQKNGYLNGVCCESSFKRTPRLFEETEDLL